MKKEVIANNKIWIPAEKTNMLRQICKRRSGSAAIVAIWKDIKKFLKEESDKSMVFNNNGEAKSREDIGRLRETYSSYLRSMGSASSLKNALGKQGVLKDHFEVLPEIIDLYIERFKHLINSVKTIEALTPRTAGYAGDIRFPPEIEAHISDLVNCLCSCPECGRPTKAGMWDSPTTRMVLGRACMIYGPVKDSPRYDPEIEIDFYEIDNGIWLCSICADKVNGKEWAKFPATKLLKWRKAHQILVYEWVTGIKKITRLGFNFEGGGHQVAINLFNYINEEEAVFMEPVPEHAVVFTTAVNNFRNYLQQEMMELKFPVFLVRQASGMIQVCNAIVAIVQSPAQFPSNKDYLLVFRKVIGSSLDTIANKYKVQMPARLRSLIPISAGNI